MRRRASSLFLIFVLVVFGLSLALPAEDLTETAYDESETLPCQSPASLSTGTSQLIALECRGASATFPQVFLRTIQLLHLASPLSDLCVIPPSRLAQLSTLRC